MKFRCENCGQSHSKWIGRCACGAWNSIVEEISVSNSKNPLHKNALSVEKLSDEIHVPERIKTSVSEFDRTIGGGLVAGAVILLAGDPGIGKSTLLLQISNSNFGSKSALYISGEESNSQIKLRAKRLGLTNGEMLLTCSNNLEEILATAHKYKEKIALLIVDSIQTISSDNLDGASGSVGQIRYCTQKLIEFAKANEIPTIIVGHVTKEGSIAGPKILEHSVDTVLYFEGERNYAFRILRSIKNRFGATDEIGVFEIADSGLKQVENPSLVFLGQQQEGAIGSIMFPSLEGSRPLIVEIQALVSNSFMQIPRRAVIGWDSARLAMICAVLEKQCKMIFGNKDIYLNVIGGMKVSEPAADLAVALALCSCYLNIGLPNSWIAFGEIGLSGEVRSVNQTPRRIEEAKRLSCRGILSSILKEKSDAEIIQFKNIKEACAWIKTRQ